MNEIVRTEQVARTPMMAGGRPMAIVPQSMEDCYRLATAVCKAGMAPKGLDTPEKAMVAVMHGMEVGLTPMAALQRIAVVNGRPTIWGDGAIGLVRGSGLCEWVRETVTGAGDAMVATCEAKRKGDPEAILRTFSVADAKKAGLWGKQGPWQQYPTRMLAMRARAFCLRDGFADVLGGLYLKEEIEDDDRSSRRAPPPPIQQQPAQVEREAAPMIEHKPEPAKRRAPAPPPPRVAEASQDKPSIITAFAERAKAAQTTEELGAAWDEVVEPAYESMEQLEKDEVEKINRVRWSELPQDGDDGGEASEP